MGTSLKSSPVFGSLKCVEWI